MYTDRSTGGDPARPCKKKVSATELLKAGALTIHPGVLHPQSVIAKHTLRHELEKSFAKQKKLALEEVEKAFKVSNAWMAKASDADDLSKEIIKAIAPEWQNLPAAVQAAIEQAALAGAQAGLAQFGAHDADMIAAVNQGARDWAHERAAELVGMKWTEAGELIPNPHAEWVIADTTRDRIRNLVTEAFESETDLSDVRNSIMDALEGEPIFSEGRADMIAKTEVSFAQTSNNFLAWQKVGLVNTVTSLLSADHEIDDQCDDNADVVVEFGEQFPSGDTMPPFHPRCECVLVAVDIDSGDMP